MNDMMKKSFEDLGAVLEAEGKSMHRHKKEGKEGKAREKNGSGSRSYIMQNLVNQGKEIYSNFIRKPVNRLKLLRAPFITVGLPRIISLF